ncbi:MAG: ribulose-phosphate 3-epimerase [Pseudomonadota bacterium]
MTRWPAQTLRIAPSILAADFGAIAAETKDVAAAGADIIHLDVMDGHFVPNITFGPDVVASVRKATDLPLDVHLMIEPPEPFLEAFAKAGADGITVHVEATHHLDRALALLNDLGVKPGVAINPATPIEALTPVLHRVALICVMTVNPGFGGQSFLPNAAERLAAVRALIGERPILVEADGGISAATAGPAHSAGADVLVAGSAIFGKPDRASAIAALRADKG